MTLEEIKDLGGRLLRDPALGWSDEPALLAKFLGFAFPFVLKACISGQKHISLPQQRKMSAALEKIAAGEVICERRLFQGNIVGEIKVPDHPKPLGWATATRCAVKVSKGGVKLSFIAKPERKVITEMPSLRRLMWPS